MMRGITTGLLLSLVPYLVSGMASDVFAVAADKVADSFQPVQAGKVVGVQAGNVVVSGDHGTMHWVAKTADGDKPVTVQGQAVFVASPDCKDGKPVVVATGNGATKWVTAKVDGGDGRSEDVETHVVHVRTNDDGEDQGGWLGVMVEANCTNGACDVKVTKVLDDSPASDAGIESGDVILSVDGQDVTGDVGQAVQLIKARKAGDDVNIVVLRGDTEQTVVATLGDRGDMPAAKFAFKFDKDGVGQVEDKIVTRGKMLKRDADGNWVVTDLGDLDNLDDLPANIRMLVPHAGQRTVEIEGDGDTHTINLSIQHDGESVKIVKRGDDDFTVTRTDADGNATEDVYHSMNELKKDDPEAADLIESHGNQFQFRVFSNVDGDWGDLGDAFKDGKAFAWKFETDDDGHGAAEWREQLEDSLAGAQKSYKDSMTALKKALEELESKDGLSGLSKLYEIQPFLNGKGKSAFAFSIGKPAYTFEVRPDGQIAATLRKGDTEVVQLFENEDDLANRKPDLYEKYLSVMGND